MNKFKIMLALTAAVLIAACTKDLIVKDIKNATINVLAPANNTKTPVNSITFWWDALDGAEKYNIQIVKPNFASAQILVADTNVVGNKYTQTLAPGIYQWRIRGMNGGGNTIYTTLNLTIDTTSDLSTQLVNPLKPANGYITGNNTITFSWDGILSATNYELQVLDGLNNVLIDTTTSKTNCSYAVAIGTNTVGVYSWKIKASNKSSVSQYNAPRTFTIDLKAPAAPALSLPINLSSFTSTVDLKWTRNEATVKDVLYDSIYIATDSIFSSDFIIISGRVNGTTINTGAFTPSLQPSASPSDYYFWKVRSLDSVGNKSNFSAYRKFHIN